MQKNSYNSNRPILVTGATGNVGRHVVQQLVQAGVPVRALTRNPATANLPDGVEVVAGDLAKPDTLTAALKGIERLFLYPVAYLTPTAGTDYIQTTAVVEYAKQAGVQRIVLLSSSGAPIFPMEQVVEASGLEWTILRPGEFAMNKKDTWAHSIRTEGLVRSAYPDVLGVPVHEADIAAVAIAALLEEGHAGQTYTLTAPEAISQREQARSIGAAIGRKIRFEELTPQQAREGMIQEGWPAEIADHILDYFEKWTTEPPVALSTVARVTGRPGRTFAQWAVDHAEDFR